MTIVMFTEAPLTIEDLPAVVDSARVELDDGGEILDVEVGDEGLYATAMVTLAGERILSENPGLGSESVAGRPCRCGGRSMSSSPSQGDACRSGVGLSCSYI